MKQIYLGFKFSISYFTILPVRFKESDDLSNPKLLSWMLFFLPLIGLILAALCVGVFKIVEPLGWLGAVIASLFYMTSYGFIHTDAIIDVADAIYAKHSGKDAYKVIKEPTVGAMGVLYGGGFLILKVATLATLLSEHLFFALFSIAIVSRFSLLLLIKNYIFKSSFVTLLHESLSFKIIIMATIFYALIGSWLLSWSFLPLLVLGVIGAFFIASVTKKYLGFINGDVLGMTLESIEVLFMIGALLLWR